MTRVTHLRPEFVTSFPTPMAHGVLYLSFEYNSCGHLCACGCGREVITPLSPKQWSVTYDGENVSLRPSIGNWTLPCRSHYVVHHSSIRWARDFTEQEVAWNRRRDRALLDGRYSDGEFVFSAPADGPGPATAAHESEASRNGPLARMIKWLRGWMR